jgi:hypothetical protein
VIILKIDGPGTGGSKDVTGFLTLPVDPTAPPPAPEPVAPTSGATSFPLGGALQWSANGATGYDVYLWRSGDPVPGTPTATVTAVLYQPVALDPGTTYLWKVVSHNANGSTTGETWTFTTGDGGPVGGRLLFHEEFDGYAAGSLIGQTGRGLGQSGAWEYQGTAGTFTLGPGLSGDSGLVVDAFGGGDCDARVEHTVAGWGSGVLYMSYLWNETSYGGHAYVSGGGGYAGAFGHAWGTSWAINNTGSGVSYNFNQTYRLVARIDWDAGVTTMWADPVSETDAPVAVRSETQSGTRTTIIRFYGTDGTIDDIRIGTDFASVVGSVGEPFIRITDFTADAAIATIVFRGFPGVTGWEVWASTDLIDFDIDETPTTVITEDQPGVYSAVVDISGDPAPYFLRIEI